MAFRSTSRRLGYIFNRDYSRMARRMPWWEPVAVGIGCCGVVLTASTAFYFGRRKYHEHFRADGDMITVMRTLDEIVLSDMFVAQVVLRMVMHDALSDTRTPFGQPMVAPAYLEKEAQRLDGLLHDLRREHPLFTMADLWALLVTRALACLGGPDNPQPLLGRGRFDELSREDDAEEPPSLAITAAKIRESDRDAQRLRIMLSGQGYTADETVALLSLRNVGYHEKYMQRLVEEGPSTGSLARMAAPLHRSNVNERVDEGEEEFKRKILARAEMTTEKTALDPCVVNNDYFISLLDFDWVAERKFPFNLWGEQRYFTKAHPYDNTATMKPFDLSLLDEVVWKGTMIRYARAESKYHSELLKAINKMTFRGYEGLESGRGITVV